MDQERQRLWDELNKLEKDIKEQVKERRAAVLAKTPELIDDIDMTFNRLVQEETDVRKEVQPQLAAPARAVPAAAP